MTFVEVAKAALELGVIPALALFLVVAMHFQNKQLLQDRKEIELQLLKTLADVVLDNQRALAALQNSPSSRRSTGVDHESAN